MVFHQKEHNLLIIQLLKCKTVSQQIKSFLDYNYQNWLLI